MSTSLTFDRYLERVEAGERLSADDIHALASTPDILPTQEMPAVQGLD